MRFASLALALVCSAALSFANPPAARPSAAAATRPSLSSSPAANLLLGNPSNATHSVRDKDNYLIDKPYFVESYNSSKGEPNWVSWVVTKDDIGSAPRKRTFDTDTTLPIGFVRIKTAEYVKAGFDRGHMCPHGDRSGNEEESYSTFVMTNILPQAPNVNRKAWEQVESYGRDELMTKGHNRVYVISGGSGVGGTGSAGESKNIGGRVVVPARCWKIMVVVPEAGGDDDLAKITTDTRVMAVDMPNDNTTVTDEWAKYRVSVDSIEKETGYHFFTALPPDVAKWLKAKVDDVPTPKPVPRVYGDKPEGQTDAR